MSSPVKTKEQALQLAIAAAKERKWPWKEPVSVRWGLLTYTVWTNARSRGGNVCLKIRKRDGAVISASLSPR
jgi:hypothetical protein